MRYPTFCLALLLASLFWAGGSSPASGAPNTDAPLEPLLTRAEEDVQALTAEAVKQYQAAASVITGMVEKMNNNELKKINPKEFSAAWVAKQRLERLGKRLEQWGETAGIDFQRRASAIHADWHMVKKEFVKLPEISSKLPLVLKTFNNDAKKRKSTLVAIGKLYQQKQYEQAETALLKDIDALDEIGCLLADDQRAEISSFTAPLGKVMAELNKIRVEAGKQRLQDLIDAEPPGFDEILAQLKQAATDLKAGNDPTFDGQPMSGPELVKAAGVSWRKAQLAAVHGAGYFASMDMRWGEAKSDPLKNLVADHEEFSAAVLADLAAVISADATRVSAEQAEEVYTAYLAELASLATLAVPGTVAKALQPSLDSLVARSAELQANVGAYQAATADLLRWRKLVADERQKAAATAFPEYAPTVATVARAPQLGAVGLLPPSAGTTQKLALISRPCRWRLNESRPN